MSTVEMVYSGLNAAIQTAMSNASLSPNIGIDWPSLNTLQGVATNGVPVISIFDRGGTRNSTTALFLSPAMPLDYGTTGAVLTFSGTVLNVLEPLTLNGSGTPLTNDCLYLVLYPVGQNVILEYICQPMDTLTTALGNFVDAINTAAIGLTAVLVGDVITVTADSGFGTQQFRAGVVNVGGYVQEIYRQNREMQITLWTKTPQDRATYGAVLEVLFATLEVNYGLTLADNDRARVMIVSDNVRKDSQLQDLFRRDFIISLDYPVTISVQAWIVESIAETFLAD